MTEYLRVQNGIAVEAWSAPEGKTLTDCFPAELVAMFHPAGNGHVGWHWNGFVFSAPTVSAVDLVAYLATKRDNLEMSGVVWNGHTVRTDPASQQRLATERLAVVTGDRHDGDPWIMADGPVTLTNAELTEIASSVRTWIKGLYTTFISVLAQIETGTIITTEQIDAASWPQQS